MAEEIVSRVISFATELIGNAWGCEEELRGLGESLTMIRAFLTDAERRQVRDESVKLWLQKLEDVAYEADDVLDEFAYENLRQKIEVGNQRKRKVRDICSTSNPLLFRTKMGEKIKAVHKKLAKANELANGFGLTRLLSVDSNVEIIPTRETDSFLDHSEVVGRKSEVSKIVSLLTSATNQQLSVIPIVGMAVSKSEILILNEDLVDGISLVRAIQSKGKSIPRIPSLKDGVWKLRTFISENAALGNTIFNFECLRVLKLYGKSIKELPSSICLLIHLRLLNISSTYIKALPKTITKLYNLQTLRIEDCFYLKELPEDLKSLINLRHIYFDGYRFSQMPKDLGQLTCLQTLQYFVVGQGIGFQIEELGRLNQLKGKLDICSLEHVKDKEASRSAKLAEKTKVYKLGFYWSMEIEDNHNNDEEVLEGLQPHRYLKSLTIEGFGGEKFPSWMLTSHDARDGFLLYDNLIHITLRNCKKCEVLPTLGLLPCLRDLEIRGMDNVRSIGTEFYGNYNDGGYDKILFPCLKSLQLWYMRNLVEWTDAMEPTTTGMVFPCLKNLTISDCKQLKSAPCHFSSLEELFISETNSTTFEKISSKLTTLESLHIEGISELASLPEQLLKNNSSLMSLRIWRCDDLVSLSPHRDVWGFYTSLRSLEISGCKKLSYLPNGLHTLCSLEEFSVSNCPNLRSFPSIKGVALLRSLAISCSDEVLRIGIESCISLSSLEIDECPNLISIPNLQDLHSLSSLKVRSCKRLVGLPDGLDCLTCLKYLSIGGFCEELDAFPSLSSIQHASLESLTLLGWAKLNSLPDDIQRFTALTELRILNFDQMEALPEWLGNLSSVRKLDLWKCMNLMVVVHIGPRQIRVGKKKKGKFSSLQELQMIKIQGSLTKLEKLKIFLVKVIQKQCEDSSPF
ncbi:hypothetical protein CMV_003043 [Castanea mollissima]|uniref:Rx N-terminal domain-containing protein n=1 Tax=Castanea mollissima TaxID=60419 RepID=A0A8J4RI61_9ROSI|nr:hypothetical protein CMV_003043 [Castanea mollissima]